MEFYCPTEDGAYEIARSQMYEYLDWLESEGYLADGIHITLDIKKKDNRYIITIK